MSVYKESFSSPNQALRTLHKLMEEHPGLEVKFFVSSYEVTDHTFTEQRIFSIDICPWHMFETGDGLILTDKEEIISGYAAYEGLTVAEAAVKYEQEVKEVILVRMGA